MPAGTEVERLIVRLVGDTKQYKGAMRDGIKQTEQFARSIDGKLRDAQGRFLTGSRKMAAELAMANGIIGRMQVRLKALGATLTTVGARFTTAGASARRFGRSMLISVTAPLAVIGGMSVRAFAQFDQAMVESTSIMKVTTAQTEAMRKAAIDLSGEAVQAPKELAEAYFFLASAGKNAEQSMALLPQVAQFATAGAFDMALATDLLTDAQSALGLSTKDVVKDTANLTMLSDKLIGANTLANASVRQFSVSLTTKAGSAIKAYNIDLNEGIGLLAAYADQGIKAELSGNALDRVVRLLTKSYADNTEVFKRLGVAVFDTSGEFNTFEKIIGDIERATAGMSTEQKTATLTALGFEARIQGVILPLLGSSKAIGGYVARLKEMDGITKAVADKQMRSFANQMKLVRNQITIMAIEIGEVLAPFIVKLTGVITKGIDAWRSWSPAIKRVVVVAGLVLAAVGPLLIIFGGMVTAIGFVITAFGTLATFVAPLFTPAGLLIGGVIAAAAAVLAYVTPWKKVTEAVRGFFTLAVGFMANFSENMVKLWSFLKENWLNVLKDIGQLWILVHLNMASNLLTTLNTMFRLWTLWNGFMEGMFERLFTIEFVGAVIAGIVAAAKKFSEFATFVFDKMKAIFKGKTFSFQDFVDQIESDFAAGKNAQTLRQLGEEAGKIIGEGMASSRGLTEGFESSIKAGPGFNFDVGAAEKLVDEILPPDTIRTSIEEAVAGARPDPIPVKILIAGNAVAIGSARAAQEMADFLNATGQTGRLGSDGAAASPVIGGGEPFGGTLNQAILQELSDRMAVLVENTGELVALTEDESTASAEAEQEIAQL